MRIQRRPVVTVFVRHAGKCANDGQEFYRGCQCPKWLRYSQNGKQHRITAMTRTWAVAEEKAGELQKRLDAGTADVTVATVAPATTMAEVLEKFFVQKQSGSEITPARIRTVRSQLQRFVDYVAGRGKTQPEKLTSDDLIHYRATWTTWKSGLTKATAQGNLRGFLRFMGRTDLLPALNTIKKSRADELRTAPKPFTEEELGTMLAKVSEVFSAGKASRITALIHLMASTGLAIRDAVGLKRSSIANGQLNIYRQKTAKQVVQALDAALYQELLTVTNGNPEYVFWTGMGLPDHMTHTFNVDLRKLMNASGVYIRGNVAHRFRDSAVDFWLGAGYTMTDIAAMLGDTVAVTEKHYADLQSQRMQKRLAGLPVRKW